MDPLQGLQSAMGPAAPSQVSQQAAVYMDGSKGPFRCDHCIHFHAPSSCETVAGPIDPAGCCDLFEPSSSSSMMGAGRVVDNQQGM